jgi:hypothetical protein
MNATDPRAPLIRGVSQYDVDFVIPRIGVDVPVGIDPFLLYKSRDAEYQRFEQANKTKQAEYLIFLRFRRSGWDTRSGEREVQA